MAYTARLKELFELPNQIADFDFPLTDLWDKLGLEDYVQAVELPDYGTGSGVPTEPAMTPDEASQMLLWYENDPEEPAPEIVPITITPIASNPTTPAKQVISFRLQALSDIQLPVFSGFTAVLNSGGFNASVTYSGTRITVETKLKLSGRFSSTLLRPMQKIVRGTEARYEPDTSKPYVEFDLAEVSIIYDTVDGLKYDAGAQIKAKQPFSIGAGDLVFDPDNVALDFSGPDKCMAVQFPKEQLKSWLKKISPALIDESPPAAKTNTVDDLITGRIFFGSESAVQEVRVDWFMAENRTLALPGVKVQTPRNTLFTLSLHQNNGNLSQLELALTFENKKSHLNQIDDASVTPTDVLWVYSTFAWGRNDEREMHTAEKADEPKLFDLRLATNAQSDTPKRVSLIMIDVDVSGGKAPTFLRQLETPLLRPDMSKADTLCTPTAFDAISLKADDWKAKFRLDDKAFRFPFLNQDKPQDNQSPKNIFEQFVEIDPPNKNDFQVDFSQKEIAFTLGVTLKFGSIQFNSDIDFAFNWEKFALNVDHDSGLKMLSEKAELESQEHLGLVWRLKGAKTEKNNKIKFHYFTLVTKDYNYQVQMAKGASFELDYVKASKEPITFIVSDLTLGAKGLDLTAEVSDRPARLNGINTRFTFNGSRLSIRENHIQDFTLSGSGPLPPDLVGDAMVDISMQFAQQQGALTLVHCKANLRGNKLLDCKGTRFQFSVDAIGMEFVNDGAFHLYFTLTGSAQFVLATGDDKQGALALLPKIKIDLVQCPLCGDPSVIAKHINLLVEFPKPKSFNFLGAFEFELRAIGFFPTTDFFDDHSAAMLISGQLRFAQGPGDTPDSRPDYHKLYIALPKPGDFFPRLHFTQIAVNLAIGEAFKLQGVVEFLDSATEKGFIGEGSIELQGLPSIAAAFGFLRVRRDENSAWVRAWFLYLEVRRLSLMIPYIEIYLREVGLGFGYRFTIASIKVADRENDVKKLISSLQELSKTQADLSRRDRWSVDLEEPGEDPRWTIVLRALFSQTSASTLIRYNEQGEKELPNIFLFDVMIAFRSDLTFYMAARGWLNTNYYTYDKNENNEVKGNPFVSGFIIIVPRRKMFLAHVASNKDAFIGNNPPLPDLIKSALKAARFSATLLIEPGLMHYELGWPNNIGWDFKFGPLAVSITSGFIFRLTSDNLVMGISYKASGTIDLKAELDLGLVGVRVSVFAYAAWGARLMGKLPLPPKGNPLDVRIYGLIGLEIRIEISIELFIRIPLVFTTIKLSFKLSLGVGFTAGMEISMAAKMDDWGIRGSGTLYIMAMGHRLEVSASLSFNGKAVEGAKKLTGDILNMGLEATEVEGVPGVDVSPTRNADVRPMSADTGLARAFAAPVVSAPDETVALAADAVRRLDVPAADALRAAMPKPTLLQAADAPIVQHFDMPGYSIFVVRAANPGSWSYFLLLPKGERIQDGIAIPETGFLPPPPLYITMRSENWVEILNTGVISRILKQAIQNVFSGTRWANFNPAEVRRIISKNEWMLTSGNQAVRVTPSDTRLALRPYTISNTEPNTFRAGNNSIPVLIALNGGNVTALRDLLVPQNQPIVFSISPKFDDRNNYPDDTQFQIVTVVPYMQWHLYYGDEIVNLQRQYDPSAYWGAFSITLLVQQYEPSEPQDRSLATDDFTESLNRPSPTAPQTVLDALELSGIKPLTSLPVAAIGNNLYTFKLGTDTYRLQWVKDADWILDVEVQNDFRFVMPAISPEETHNHTSHIEQYRPNEGWSELKPSADQTWESAWKVNWNAQLLEGKSYDIVDNKKLVNERTTSITLAQYLTYAYELAPIKNSPYSAISPQIVPLRDPEVGDMPKPLSDDRVQNPTDNSYEAAVRGALEQFAGSPYFKHDPNNVLYDKMLQEAFQDNTTIYTADGKVPDEPARVQRMQETQQSRQLRGMVVQDLIGSLNEYIQKTASSNKNAGNEPINTIPFQMGLIFRYQGGTPFWLDNFVVEGTLQPSIQQRNTPSSTAPSASKQAAETFNILSTAFNANPPRFQRVQQYTSSATIAIAWDLEWSQPLDERCTPAQKDPQHHLAHYMVRRRALEGGERDLVYQVKPSHAAHRRTGDDGPTGILMLQSRFQVVDHFTQETAEDRGSLPESGRSYLYTITPVDFAGNAGRPLTLIATRYPDEVPPVPLNGELTVTYRLQENDLIPEDADTLLEPLAFPPSRVQIAWEDNLQTQSNGHVAVRDYRLIFRKDPTIPVGSYGLDSTTQRAPAYLLPTSNARPLASDIKITLENIDADPLTGRRSADILPQLQAVGIVASPSKPAWRPEAWRVFFQTISANGVPSSLVPVELRLRAETQPAGVEERAPSEIEWLARPIRFPILPPEDQRAIPGMAHFPMPSADQFTFKGSLSNVTFRLHPARIRCIRFRWNQGPSNIPGYPLDLNAGYHLLLLDIDAQPDDTFDNSDELEAALRPIQEVQMLPAADLFLQPSGTGATSQWEAWYPSAIRRMRSDELMAKMHSQNRYGPWYSWRESRLVWPYCPPSYITQNQDGTFTRSADVHSFLSQLVEALKAPVDGDDSAYLVTIQPPPAIQPNTWATFKDNTAVKNDPYGWAILQRLGLSVTFALRDARSGELVTGDTLLRAVQSRLVSLANTVKDSDNINAFDHYYKHLFVELLFQPGKSVHLETQAAAASDLLALIQISLRPVAEQYLTYHKLAITGPTGSEIEAEFVLNANQQLTLVNDGDPDSGSINLEGPADGTPIKQTYKIPVGGAMQLAFRGEAAANGPKAVNIRVKLATAPKQSDTGALASAPWLVYEKDVVQKVDYLRIDTTKSIPDNITPDVEQAIRDAFAAADPLTDNTSAINTILGLKVSPLTPFAPTDELSTRFAAPAKLNEWFATAGHQNAVQWQLFRSYVLALNAPDAAQQIVLSVSQKEIGEMLSSFLDWSQRFFDIGPDVIFAKGIGSVAEQGTVSQPTPWMATAYPRAGSPAYASPDGNGRLQYDHLFEDRWAHNYRFYIRPYGRYDLIWNSFSQSRALFPLGLDANIQQKREPARPEPLSGALDVVIERIQPVEMPLILSSSRLDKPTIPGQPVPPGKIWEVIIAQHPEQGLVERNQTIARQLAFRQVAFTLLRRYTDPNWATELSKVVSRQAGLKEYMLHIRMVSQETPPGIPTSYPAVPDHLLLDNLDKIGEDDARSLAIPARVSTFQQGALVLQWRGLPFYYTHRLLVIAQTASQVSPINQTEQSNFEYVAPSPSGLLSGTMATQMDIGVYRELPPPLSPTRRLAIPLRRFWDSLPPDAQAAWPEERPDTQDSLENTRKFSSLPDPAVVYQLVEVFSGNIEVQVEFFYDGTASPPVYAARQLGKHFYGRVTGILAPPDKPTSGKSIHDDFVLLTEITQITEELLSATVRVPQPLTGKVTIFGKRMLIKGILTRGEKEQLQKIVPDIDKPTIDALYNDWFSEEPVSEDRTSALPANLKSDSSMKIDRADFIHGDKTQLVWTGTMSDAEKTALLALSGDSAFKAGLVALVENVAQQPANGTSSAGTVVSIVNDPEPIPDALTTTTSPIKQTDRLTLQKSTDGQTYTALTWKGFLLDDELPAFEAAAADWGQIGELKTALNTLRNQLETRRISKPLPPPPTPLVQADLPPSIMSKLFLPNSGDFNLRWFGYEEHAAPNGAAPTDAERAILESLTGYPAFVEAVKKLLAAYDADMTMAVQSSSVVLPSLVPPEYKTITDRLSLNPPARGTQNPTLTWKGPLIKDQERMLLRSWVNLLNAFLKLREQLANQDDPTHIQIPIEPSAVLPTVDEMKILLPHLYERGVFTYDPDKSLLIWGKEAPIDAELKDIAGVTGTEFAFPMGLILFAIDASRFTPLKPPVTRPYPGTLDSSIQAQLVIEPEAVTWNGRVKSQSQYKALAALAQDMTYGKEFCDAVAAILKELSEAALNVPFDPPMAVRPQQNGLPPELAEKFLLGRWRLRFYGLMVLDQGKALIKVFSDSHADQQAIQRLYATSLQRGMQGRKLMLRARRGSAKPSDMIALQAEPLQANQ